jgi:hypothetical protein
VARTQKATPERASNRPPFGAETLYLVRRLYEGGWDSIFCNSAASECRQRPEWGGPVKACAGRDRAEALCRELGAKLLEGMNPFEAQGSGLADLTSLPPGPFRDWLRDVGLTPLPPGKNRLVDWGRWGEKTRAGTTAVQRHRVLAGLDKLRFYAVAELDPPAETPGREPGSTPGESASTRGVADGTALIDVFTVELTEWKDDDDFLASQGGAWMTSVEPCFSSGGGIRLATFRNRGPAATYRDELQRQVPHHSRAFDRNGFRVAGHPIEVEA